MMKGSLPPLARRVGASGFQGGYQGPSDTPGPFWVWYLPSLPLRNFNHHLLAVPGLPWDPQARSR